MVCVQRYLGVRAVWFPWHCCSRWIGWFVGAWCEGVGLRLFGAVLVVLFRLGT